MPVSNRLKNQHLLWRAAFGPMAENAAVLDNTSPKKMWELLVKTSAKEPEKIDIASNFPVQIAVADRASDGFYIKVEQIDLHLDVVRRTRIEKHIFGIDFDFIDFGHFERNDAIICNRCVVQTVNRDKARLVLDDAEAFGECNQTTSTVAAH